MPSYMPQPRVNLQIYGTCDGGSYGKADARGYYVDELLAPFVVQDSISDAPSIVSTYNCY
jgi:hypothetical protein